MKYQSIPLILAVEGDQTQKLPSDGQGTSVGPGSPGSPGSPGTTQSVPGQGPPPADQGSPFSMFLIFGVLGFFMLMMFNGQRRERKRQAKLLASVTKGSKVVTAGGVIGNVVEVRDHEVVVKVDENANTRIRFTKEAIKTVIQNKSD